MVPLALSLCYRCNAVSAHGSIKHSVPIKGLVLGWKFVISVKVQRSAQLKLIRTKIYLPFYLPIYLPLTFGRFHCLNFLITAQVRLSAQSKQAPTQNHLNITQGTLRHYLMAVVELFKYQLRETLECYVENFNSNLNSNLNLNNTVTKNSKNYIPNYIINQNVIFLVNP